MKLEVFTIILAGISLFWISCDKLDPEDHEGPTVTIVNPVNNETVFELVFVETISPNFDVVKVELWINQVNPDFLIELEISLDSFINSIGWENESESNISSFINSNDNTLIGIDTDGPPFIINWNTTTPSGPDGELEYPDSSFNYLTARAFDSNGNFTYSPGVLVMVDNSLAVPNGINITNIKFSNGGLVISWNTSQDSDFQAYLLEKSLESNMSNSEYIDTIINQIDTSYFDTEIDPLIYQYYRIAIADTFDFITNGEIFSSSLDPLPNSVDIESVDFDMESMIITWETNADSDFSKYRLVRSDSQDGETTLLADYFLQTDTIHIIPNPGYDPTIENWYSILVIDTLSQSIIGAGATNIPDSPPVASSITSVSFNVDVFDIEWEQNNEEDFISYSLFESNNSDFSDSELIYSSDENMDTFFQVGNIFVGEQRYYQVEVEDFWELVTASEIFLADANYWFTQTFGGEGVDKAHSVVHTSDGGYILGGETNSFGSTDIWVIKVDSLANEEWYYHYDNPLSNCNSIYQTFDGGFILLGYLFNYPEESNQNILMIKLDQAGNEEFKINPCEFCGEINSYGQSGIQTNDGGYIITGYIKYSNSDELLVIKTDNTGNPLWHYISDDTDNFSTRGCDIIEDEYNPGNYVVVGWQSEIDIENKDIIIAIVDNSGELLQQGKYDSGADDEGYAIEQGAFGYVVAGYTTINGSKDMLLTEFVINNEDSLIVNWIKEYGGSGDEKAYGLTVIDGGGFILVGYTESYGSGGQDVYVVKTDGFGTKEWDHNYGGGDQDLGEDIQQTFEGEGGFIITGSTRSFGAGNWDYWLIKTNSLGETSPY